ncbi:unnamed protein product, partial [Prorocentrum cordatum]
DCRGHGACGAHDGQEHVPRDLGRQQRFERHVPTDLRADDDDTIVLEPQGQLRGRQNQHPPERHGPRDPVSGEDVDLLESPGERRVNGRGGLQIQG